MTHIKFQPLTAKFRGDTSAPDERFSCPYVDHSKIMLLYIQMHKIASENPDAIIYFDFYDDRFFPETDKRAHLDIVYHLGHFFEKNSQLVPHNVHLRTHGYSGPISYYENDAFQKRVELAGSKLPIDMEYNDRARSAAVTRAKNIQGIGLIDPQYEESARKIFARGRNNILIEFNLRAQLLADFINQISANFQTLFEKTIDGIPKDNIPLRNSLNVLYNAIIDDRKLTLSKSEIDKWTPT